MRRDLRALVTAVTWFFLLTCSSALFGGGIKGYAVNNRDGSNSRVPDHYVADPHGGHRLECWQDSDCPRYWTCNGKPGQLDVTGQCPPDYSCWDDPSQALP